MTRQEERVLILAPTGRDASVAVKVLCDAGFSCEHCTNMNGLCDEIAAGAGAVLLTDEVLNAGALSALVETLNRQPSWSDLPLIVFPASLDNFAVLLDRLGSVANVTILERPVRIEILSNAVRGALRARRRQYATRDLFMQLENADRQKDLFLATLSHELRTPLTSILGWCRLLMAGEVSPEKTRRALEVIDRNATAQSQLIADILSVSQIVAGSLRIEKEPLDLVSVVEAAVETIRPAAAAKNIQMECSFEARPAFILGDGGRLQQVFSNVLLNAVKFTGSGGRIDVRVAAGDRNCTVTVQDNGKGISAEFLPFVFDRFRQADSSFTRSQGGLGLGLAIVRHLVELHGGTVGAESPGEGRGATIKVSLPLAIGDSPHDAPAAAKVSGTLDGLRILAVEDDPDALVLLENVLTRSGATVVTVNSSKAAVEAAKQQIPDILVSDIGLPEFDGYDLLQRIRSIGSGAERLTAVALTGYASPKDRQQALAAGFHAHLSKPFEPNELVETILKLAAR